MSIDPVERRLEQSFEAERWTRFIQDCQDLEQLRETALALVQQLAQQKAASAWMASFMDMAILQKGCFRPSEGVPRGSGPQALVRIC